MVPDPPPNQYISEKPFSRAFRMYPTYPLGHSAGTNEATKAPTPENAPCWHQTRRPREIYKLLVEKSTMRVGTFTGTNIIR